VHLNPAPATFAQALDRFVGQFFADARFYQGLTRTGTSGPGSLLRAALGNRGLWLLTFHRIGYHCVSERRRRSPTWWFARLCHGIGSCFNVAFCKSAFSADCEIDGVVYLSNRGYLVCGALSIGAGSLIHERCTFGSTVAGGGEGRPFIGKRVWIGPNCIIAGSLTVGDGATVLPGSFLTHSVPPGAVVKGNPAQIVRTNFDNSTLRRSLTVVQDVAADHS
jgi:serine acetyltransferase